MTINDNKNQTNICWQYFFINQQKKKNVNFLSITTAQTMYHFNKKICIFVIEISIFTVTNNTERIRRKKKMFYLKYEKKL